MKKLTKINCPNCNFEIQAKSFRAVNREKVKCSNCDKTLTFRELSFLWTLLERIFISIELLIALVIFLSIVLLSAPYWKYNDLYLGAISGVITVSYLYFCDKILQKIRLKYQLTVKKC